MVSNLNITSGPGGASDLRAKCPPNFTTQHKTESRIVGFFEED
ncbi:hypothetical protein LEP1GSC016_0247 [Leptospira borgpetersenii serovar Hardjo-bovis str. Sponselee]|uniref:Uncharacterized protein n=2 Tax=Leptospira borgpetersenii TaxID=174 RepID=M6CFA6_LEPBO|nr:hypothetical protein LEP1GSC101_3331 [Leptospira borgpetersenii str. UI 09149]EMJ84945.1 hypothetical protein LEP1GSC016_0247 [Leptospira borgpetersenii serovar Hardjo-bovis str. Sponselee]EMO11960.1 hypothetical protein LEP1GSC137_0782 [Leptospira borgpetersenii str. Noumea 25]EPG57870.1 hypothetical protein LEP1GSC103_2992 [Leptospira borgpetersenii serovar Javanica str. UI 09931]